MVLNVIFYGFLAVSQKLHYVSIQYYFVVEVVESRSQCHQHFTRDFFADILGQKNFKAEGN